MNIYNYMNLELPERIVYENDFNEKMRQVEMWEYDMADDLIGYENDYKINKKGCIFSKYYKKKMSSYLNDQGYELIGITKNNIRKQKRVHRLLAIQYIENPNDYNEVDHINNIRNDNRLCNLRWVNHTENMLNTSRNISRLTEEELAIRNENEYNRNKNYQREWAEQKRRKEGIKARTKMDESIRKQKEKEKNKKYREANKDTLNAKKRAKPISEHEKEQNRIRANKYREQNAELVKQKKALWYAQNKDTINAKRAEKYKAKK